MEHIIKLPDLASLTPFTWLGCNPRYSRSSRESTDWMLSYGALSGEKRARVVRTNADLLGAYTVPYADPKGLRLTTDHLVLLYVIDELTDDQSDEDASAARDTFTKALTADEVDASPVALATKDFMERFAGAPEALIARFVKHQTDYLDAVAQEARLRNAGQRPTLDEYFRLRRQNGGVFMSFDMSEAALGIDFPEEVLENETFKNIVIAAVDIIGLANDLYSFEIEYKSGTDFLNSVASIMHYNEGLSPQDATDRACEMYKQRCADFMAYKENMPSFGAEVDEMVRKYVMALEQWISGYNAWQLETSRFFGDRSKEVNSTGIAKIVAQPKAIKAV